MSVFHGLRVPPPPGRWVERAACRSAGVDRWFPDQEEIGRQALSVAVAEARSVCARCPVQQPCLAYALEAGVEGVWGGMTERERRAIRCRRRREIT